MKYLVTTLLFATFLIGCVSQSGSNSMNREYSESGINSNEFKQLLNRLAEGWNTGDAELAASCFTQDAIYIEPPDKQLYFGKQELYEFFGGKEGRTNPMTMDWHNLVFDEEKQIGTGEYTFGYKGRLTHGIVIVQISNRKLRRWREYQYRTTIKWEEFIGKSVF